MMALLDTVASMLFSALVIICSSSNYVASTDIPLVENVMIYETLKDHLMIDNGETKSQASVYDETCEKYRKWCSVTGGACVFESGTLTCKCPKDGVYTEEKGCSMPEPVCEQEHPLCRKTRGSCIFDDTGAVTCSCPAQATYTKEKGCTVEPGVCKSKFPKCDTTGGSCIIDDDKKIKCECPGKKMFHEKQGCIDECNPDAEDVCENGGQCTVTDEKNICSCINGTSGHFCEIVDVCRDDEQFCGDNDATCYFDVDFRLPDCRCNKDILQFDFLYWKCRKPCDSGDDCKNGAQCALSSFTDHKFCECKNGTSGDRCENVDVCKTDTCGKKTSEVDCKYDETSESAACICKDPKKAFSSTNKECYDFDGCILKALKNECNKLHEICVSGECSCQEGYKHSKNNESCEENKCADCPTDAKCDESTDDLCECVNGYSDGVKCVKYKNCATGLSKCQHSCNKTTGNCICEQGFTISSDGYSCESEDDSLLCSSLECGSGTCIKKGGKDTCICPPATHVKKNNTCVDLCIAGNGVAPESLNCPTKKCESDGPEGIRCKCDGFYEQAEDGIHCQRKEMCKEPEAIEECEKKSALCTETRTGKGYKCECDRGFGEDGKKVCKKLCELDVNREKCAKIFAVCELDENYKPFCKCPPMLMNQGNGPCNQIAENSYLGNMTLPKSLYEIQIDETGRQKRSTDLIDSRKVMQDLKLSIPIVYPEYQDIKILEYKTDEEDVICTVELQLTKPPTDVNAITSVNNCYDLEDDYCLIKPNLVLKRGKKADLFKETEPCEDDLVKNNLCDQTTKCTPGSRKNFKCTCADGFYAIGSYNPVVNNPDTFVEKCSDFDECKNSEVCPSNTSCLNTYGSYECICKDGFRKKDTGSDPKKDGCIAVCDPNPCMNEGECVKVSSHRYSCKCKPEFSGIFCNETVFAEPIKVDHRNAAIVGGVLGTLLVIVLIAAIVLYRKLNQPKDDEDDEYARHRIRGIARIRGRAQHENPDREIELRPSERRRDSGEYRREYTEERMIPRVQMSRSRNGDQERREDEGIRSKMQYRNRGFEEE